MKIPPSTSRRERQSGAAIVVFSLLAVTVILPMVGLGIDGGILYMLQAKLSQACDAAALAGGRNLNIGNDSTSQAANAEATMTQFFNANFPAGTWNSQTPSVSLNVTATGVHTRTTTVDATVVAPLYFMRVVGKNWATIAAHGQATRKDINMMLVLDRSYSMQTAGVCSQMVTQARNFVSQFANGHDQIGLITFMSGSNVDYAPTVNFKTATPSLDTTLSTLACSGNTGSAQAISQAYAQLQAMELAQPTSLNMMVFFTDGQPNGLTFNLKTIPMKTQSDSRYGTGWDPYGDTTVYYTMPKSNCAAGTATTGVMATQTYDWNGAYATIGMLNSATTSISSTTEAIVSGTTGCNFPTSYVLMREDIAYMPSTDAYGNSTSGYKGTETMPSGGPYAGKIRVDTGTSLLTASINAADHAAYTLRNNTTLKATIFTIGLGGTSTQPIDQDFLERVANDPRGSSYSTSQMTGRFVYASDISQLGAAFQAVASTILRLSQ